MSKLTVSTIATPDVLTSLTLATGNTSAGRLTISSASNTASFSGNSTVNFFVTEETTGPSLKLKANTTIVGIGPINSYPLLFLMNNAEVARFDTSGNLGINTTSPATGVHIADKTLRITSAGGNPTIQMGRTSGFALIYNATDNRFAINYDGTLGTGTLSALQIDSLGRIGINGAPDNEGRVHSYCSTVTNNFRAVLLNGAHDCTNFFSIGAYGTYSYDHFGAWIVDSGGTSINVFRVANTGQMQANGFYNSHQRTTYDRSWENYPSIQNYNDSTYGPQGEFRIHGVGGPSGGDFAANLRVDGVFIAGSDARRKTNIESIDNALDIVKNLDGKKFNIINREGNLDPMIGDKKQYGFIAQECINVIPEAVTFYEESDTPNENGWASAYAISYDRLTAVLVNAVKELSTKNDALEIRLAALEAK